MVSTKQTEVIKREVLEGDKAEFAKKNVARAANKSLRESKNSEDVEESLAEKSASPEAASPGSSPK